MVSAMSLLLVSGIKAQISIVSISLQPFNIVPEALLNVSIMNNETEQQVQLFTQLFNSSNVVIMTVKSEPFMLKKGLNAGLSERKVATTDYSGGQQSSYLKTSHAMPSGRYKVCASLLLSTGADKLDDYCEEIEAEFNQYLYLINPLDNDTIDSKNPMLSWTHSEPFTILNQGEFYRMVVTEMKKDQSPEDAIIVNSPVMVKNYLKEHQQQYPYDARELKEGGKYAWQVQKISDGVIINKTEAWIFNMRKDPETKSLKYVALKSQLDGAFYTAYDGKVFFKFSEEYKTTGNLKFTLIDAKSKPVSIAIIQDKEKGKGASSFTKLKLAGDNRFELNLDAEKLTSGFYTLTVKNEKNESFYLKIFLP